LIDIFFALHYAPRFIDIDDATRRHYAITPLRHIAAIIDYAIDTPLFHIDYITPLH